MGVWVSQETDSEMEAGTPGVSSGSLLRLAPGEGKGLWEGEVSCDAVSPRRQFFLA